MPASITRGDVQRLVCDAALLLDRATVGSSNSRDAWRVTTGETAYDIEHDTVQDKVVVAVKIMEVASALGAATCALLLRYNWQWRTTGGLRIGLSDVPGHLALIAEVNASSLTAARLATALSNMAVAAAEWAQIVRTSEQGYFNAPGGARAFHDLA